MINMLDLMAGHFHDKIVELVKAGKKFYTVNDNLNCQTTVKNMRMDHRNKQHNWFASIIVFERVDFSHLDNVTPLGDINNFSNENYLLSPEEVWKLQSDFKILVGRVFIEFFKQPQFAAVKKLIPDHILHRYTKEMSTKSEVFPLPIQFKDEKKYSDVVDILASHEETFEKIFRAANDDNDSDRGSNIPVDFSCPSGKFLGNNFPPTSEQVLVTDSDSTQNTHLKIVIFNFGTLNLNLSKAREDQDHFKVILHPIHDCI